MVIECLLHASNFLGTGDTSANKSKPFLHGACILNGSRGKWTKETNIYLGDNKWSGEK